MTSAQDFRHHSSTLLEITGMPYFKRKLQNWWRQHVIDEDPYDNEAFFPSWNQSDEEDNWQLNLFTDPLQGSAPVRATSSNNPM